jgi:aryl-alcohol dehydrogenase-like predicted oxidoreductase
VTENGAVLAAAKALGATAAQLGLAWLLAHAPNVLLIPGTSSLGHMAENVAVGQVRLNDEVMAVLDNLAPRPD